MQQNNVNSGLTGPTIFATLVLATVALPAWSAHELNHNPESDGIHATVPKYNLGATGPAGGFVFYVTDDGLHGLEAAPVDQGVAQWGCNSVTVARSTGTRIGSGELNTHDIVAQCEPGTAADIADAFSINGYYDWYLPSKDALDLMYNNLHLSGLGGFSNDYYWSSSESAFNGAQGQGFGSGSQLSVGKIGKLSTRAVRDF